MSEIIIGMYIGVAIIIFFQSFIEPTNVKGFELAGYVSAIAVCSVLWPFATVWGLFPRGE